MLHLWLSGFESLLQAEGTVVSRPGHGDRVVLRGNTGSRRRDRPRASHAADLRTRSLYSAGAGGRRDGRGPHGGLDHRNLIERSRQRSQCGHVPRRSSARATRAKPDWHWGRPPARMRSAESSAPFPCYSHLARCKGSGCCSLEPPELFSAGRIGFDCRVHGLPRQECCAD